MPDVMQSRLSRLSRLCMYCDMEVLAGNRKTSVCDVTRTFTSMKDIKQNYELYHMASAAPATAYGDTHQQYAEAVAMSFRSQIQCVGRTSL